MICAAGALLPAGRDDVPAHSRFRDCAFQNSRSTSRRLRGRITKVIDLPLPQSYGLGTSSVLAIAMPKKLPVNLVFLAHPYGTMQIVAQNMGRLWPLRRVAGTIPRKVSAPRAL